MKTKPLTTAQIDTLAQRQRRTCLHLACDRRHS